MTDQNKTLIAALLDRSGSMSTSKKATEEGFNGLMKEQAAQPGQALVTLAQFDSYSTTSGMWNTNPLSPVESVVAQVPEFIYRMRDITNVPKLNIEPRGGTPLLDAIGNFVTGVGKDLAKMREEDRPGTVICLILTDGQENMSRTWSKSKVKELIEQQESQWNWHFMFLGANMDAVGEGAAMGFSPASSLTYDDSSPGAVAAAYSSSSVNMTQLRSTGFSEGFTDADREASAK